MPRIPKPRRLAALSLALAVVASMLFTLPPTAARAAAGAFDFRVVTDFFGEQQDSVGGIVVQPDGKIVVGGTVNQVNSSEQRSLFFGDFGLARYVADGVVNGQGCEAPRFLLTPDLLAGRSPGSVAVADFNLDNKPDLAVRNFTGTRNVVSVLLGDGHGGFGAPADFPFRLDATFVAVGDFNLDAKPDVVVANQSSNSVSVRLGDGQGRLGPRATFDIGGDPTASLVDSVAVGDFNLDGKPDLAVSDISSDSVAVLPGDGRGGFGAPATYAVGEGPREVVSADFNLDNKPDLAFLRNAVGSRAIVAVLLGDGQGGFDLRSDFGPPGFAVALTAGDFNLDGKPDLAAASTTHHTVSVLLGDGQGGFARTDFDTGQFRPASVAAGDFNRDGKPDLALGVEGSINHVSVLVGNGQGDFGAPAAFEVGPTRSIAAGDFNLDGEPDLAVANSVLINDDCAGPAPATDVQVTKSGPPAALVNGTITYSFRVANNGPNQAEGVTLTDALPAGVSILSVSPNDICTRAATVTCRFPVNRVGARHTVTIVVRVDADAAGVITNTASVSANGFDPDPTNNVAESRTVVAPLMLDLASPTVSSACVNSTTGRVQVLSTAPAGGIVVTLASDNPAAAVPPSVTIPAGRSFASFPIAISPVAGTVRGKVKASIAGASVGRLLTVRPNNARLSLANAVTGGSAAMGAVVLDCPAAHDTVFALSSSDPAVANPTVPSITIPTGQSMGTFTINTSGVSVVNYPVITATANGFGAKKKLRVKP